MSMLSTMVTSKLVPCYQLHSMSRKKRIISQVKT